MSGRRPLLQFPLETLEATVANARAIGVALRDRVSGRIVGYALGSALENHDEEGVSRGSALRREQHVLPAGDGHAADGAERRSSSRTTCWSRCARARSAAGFEFLSTLIEDRVRETGPAWFQGATVLQRIDNYLRSGSGFAYLQVALQPAAATVPSS